MPAHVPCGQLSGRLRRKPRALSLGLPLCLRLSAKACRTCDSWRARTLRASYVAPRLCSPYHTHPGLIAGLLFASSDCATQLGTAPLRVRSDLCAPSFFLRVFLGDGKDWLTTRAHLHACRRGSHAGRGPCGLPRYTHAAMTRAHASVYSRMRTVQVVCQLDWQSRPTFTAITR